ncbi:MAG: cytochrome c-type biogenesis protein CcmH [Halieaceae bacterium]|nr:cytochrome c-type biogenesis protein CcmH [Halieaceae bacterium]
MLCALFLVSSSAWAVIETYEFSSPDLASRYHQLSQELRCPKCQNQNIADSNAPIARDLRVVLYEQLEAGQTDAQILDFMVARYGQFVRYRPEVDRQTALLWWSPLLLLVLGGVGVGRHFRKKDHHPAQGLTAAERDQVDRLLEDRLP